MKMIRPSAGLILLAVLLAAGPTTDTVAQFKNAPEGGFPPPTGQIAFVRDRDLWIMGADGSDARQLVSSGRLANRVEWSPDNTEILFCQDGFQQYQLPSGGGGKIKLYDIFATRAAGKGGTKQVTTDAISASPSYFPGGDRIAFTRNIHALDLTKEVPNFQVFVGGTYGDPKPVNLNKGKVSTQLQLLTPAVSPDGKKIACAITNEETLSSAKQVLGIVIFPAEGFKGTLKQWYDEAAKIPVASGPTWSPDGRYLAYVDASKDPRSLALYDFERELSQVIYAPLRGFDLASNSPSWSSDGNWLVFSNVKGNVLMVDKNGGGLQALTKRGSDAYPVFSN
jgi:Tol biopolymer transport system component